MNPQQERAWLRGAEARWEVVFSCGSAVTAAPGGSQPRGHGVGAAPLCRCLRVTLYQISRKVGQRETSASDFVCERLEVAGYAPVPDAERRMAHGPPAPVAPAAPARPTPDHGDAFGSAAEEVVPVFPSCSLALYTHPVARRKINLGADRS